MSASNQFFPQRLKGIPIEAGVGIVAEAVVVMLTEAVVGSVEGAEDFEEVVVACP